MTPTPKPSATPATTSTPKPSATPATTSTPKPSATPATTSTPKSSAPSTSGSGPVAEIPASVSGPLATGDTRSVSEPTLPTACATVTATLTLTDRMGTSSQEASPPDTTRIQKALNSCAQNGSSSVGVYLRSSGGNSHFLTGPLTLGQGVVLVLDSDVTLFGSRNPANYQVSGSPTCGTIASTKGGCFPLITVSGANAGIEGVRAATATRARSTAGATRRSWARASPGGSWPGRRRRAAAISRTLG